MWEGGEVPGGEGEAGGSGSVSGRKRRLPQRMGDYRVYSRALRPQLNSAAGAHAAHRGGGVAAAPAMSCAKCGSAEDEPGRNDILLCDACDAGYHMRCLQPPLEAVPPGDWFCAQCAAARGGSPACAAGVIMPAGWEAVPLLWSIAFVWPKGAPFTETLSGQTGGRGALNAPLGICL